MYKERRMREEWREGEKAGGKEKGRYGGGREGGVGKGGRVTDHNRPLLI